MREDSSKPGDIIDVTDLSLHDLDKIDESSLSRVLRSVIGRDSEMDPVAAFGSRI